MGIAQQVDTTDFHVEAIDLLSNHVPCEAGIALVVAVYSAIKKHSVVAGLVILGDLSIQGNIKSVRSLAEPLQVGMDNGARRALGPAGEQAELPRSLRRHRGAGRSGVLLRPDDGGDEGAGDDMTTPEMPIVNPRIFAGIAPKNCGPSRSAITSRRSSVASSGKTGPRPGWSRWSSRPDGHLLGRCEGQVGVLGLPRGLRRPHPQHPRGRPGRRTRRRRGRLSGGEGGRDQKAALNPMAKLDFLRLPVVSAGAEFLVMGHLMRRNILAYKAPHEQRGVRPDLHPPRPPAPPIPARTSPGPGPGQEPIRHRLRPGLPGQGGQPGCVRLPDRGLPEHRQVLRQERRDGRGAGARVLHAVEGVHPSITTTPRRRGRR